MGRLLSSAADAISGTLCWVTGIRAGFAAAPHEANSRAAAAGTPHLADRDDSMNAGSQPRLVGTDPTPSHFFPRGRQLTGKEAMETPKHPGFPVVRLRFSERFEVKSGTRWNASLPHWVGTDSTPSHFSLVADNGRRKGHETPKRPGFLVARLRFSERFEVKSGTRWSASLPH